jgi:hypothetical protein
MRNTALSNDGITYALQQCLMADRTYEKDRTHVSHCPSCEYTSSMSEQPSGKGNPLFLSNYTDKNANIKNNYMFIFT